jgi:hypothetical protein
MIRTPIKNNPKLFDKLFAVIQRRLADELPWLDHAFGKAERLVKVIGGKRYYTPNVYVGSNEYEDITPDTTDIGNYSFFTLDDPTIVRHERGARVKYSAPFNLIVWFDLRNIEDDDQRNTEAVKEEVLKALTSTFFREGSITITRLYERAENVFNGFSFDETENQFLMHPFAGFRINGTAEIEDECEIL